MSDQSQSTKSLDESRLREIVRDELKSIIEEGMNDLCICCDHDVFTVFGKVLKMAEKGKDKP